MMIFCFFRLLFCVTTSHAVHAIMNIKMKKNNEKNHLELTRKCLLFHCFLTACRELCKTRGQMFLIINTVELSHRFGDFYCANANATSTTVEQTFFYSVTFFSFFFCMMMMRRGEVGDFCVVLERKILSILFFIFRNISARRFVVWCWLFCILGT